jgi:hypothetical protein
VAVAPVVIFREPVMLFFDGLPTPGGAARDTFEEFPVVNGMVRATVSAADAGVGTLTASALMIPDIPRLLTAW